VLSITPKLTDPGAVKRKQVFVDVPLRISSRMD
jgi:hypothetical protein